MGRKNLVRDFVSVSAADMSQASIKGTSTVVEGFDNLSYLFTWSGGQTTNGNIGIEYSLDNIAWHVLDFGSTISLDAISGDHKLEITAVTFAYARPFYTKINGSASGALTVELSGSNKGG